MLHFASPFICRWTLGCFHILANVINAARNVGVEISLQDPALNFGHILRSGIAELYGNSLFPTVAEPFYIPTNGAQGFQFLHLLTNTCSFLSFL